MAQAPVLWNVALSAIMAGVGTALLLGRGSKWLYILIAIWCIVLWVLFQGFGMVFSGMATDPNTAPLWILMLSPGWLTARVQKISAML